MTEILKNVIGAIGIDIGKTSFQVVGLDGRGTVMPGRAKSGPHRR